MLCSKDFFRKATYNHETCEQMWCSSIADHHDTFCNCEHVFAHFLTCIFPPGHEDRNKTINQILARDYQSVCRGGGTAEENLGMVVALHADGDTSDANGDHNHTTAEDLAFADAVAVAEENIR